MSNSVPTTCFSRRWQRCGWSQRKAAAKSRLTVKAGSSARPVAGAKDDVFHADDGPLGSISFHFAQPCRVMNSMLHIDGNTVSGDHCINGQRAAAVEEFELRSPIDQLVLLARICHGVVPRAMLNPTWFVQAALSLQNRTIEALQATRALLNASVVESSVDRLKVQVQRLQVADPQFARTEVGPLIHPRQVERVHGDVQRAVAAGTTLLWGGDRHEFGAPYCQPTWLGNVKQIDAIVQNEVFVPVLTLKTFETDADMRLEACGFDERVPGYSKNNLREASDLRMRELKGGSN